MRKTFLALSFLALILLSMLIVGASLGAAQSESPVKNARPTPAPDRVIATQNGPSSPDGPALPDLVVESITVEPAQPLIGESVLIEVVIKNQGTADVSVDPVQNFWSDLYIDPGVVPIELGQHGVAEWPCQAWWVPKDGSYALTATYTFTDVKTYALYAQVDTDNHVPGELNENNNVLGPVHIQVVAPDKIVHQTHEDFQMGLASSLDTTHPEGVIRRGIFVEPYQEPGDVPPGDPDVYHPDVQIDDPPLPPSHPNNVNQVKPALASNEQGELYAAWEDGRNGGVFNRDIYFSRSYDGGVNWLADVKINKGETLSTVRQGSPDLAYDATRDRVYAVWQDEREGDFDIFFAYSDYDGATWSTNQKISVDPPESLDADQLNPSIVVCLTPTIKSTVWGIITDTAVVVVWQDQRNGHDDIYLSRSRDGGETWSPGYYVTDDPDMRGKRQVNPSVSCENEYGRIVVAWEDWRDPLHPEVYTMWSKDRGTTFGIDVPVSIPPAQSYRIEPSVVATTTVETWWETGSVTEEKELKSSEIMAIHVAWQEGKGSESDVYYAYAPYEFREPDDCPHPFEYCFSPPQKVSGFVQDSEYVRPPEAADVWDVDHSWQGQVALDLVPNRTFTTTCHFGSTTVYSKGLIVAWSDGRTYDDWRHEIRTRRVASPEGDPKIFEVCEDWAVGVVNDNAKLYGLRDDLDAYDIYKPSATGQFNPDIAVDKSGIYVVWDDDREDVPTEPGTVRDRDVFGARMITYWPTTTVPPREGVYVSPVIDGFSGTSKWYVLSWWGATEHQDDLLFQTRFGNTPYPPQSNTASGTWTKWTGNPGSDYLGCSPGVDCYYDAPGRHIVRPDGSTWVLDPNDPEQYRYIQYKIIIRDIDPLTLFPSANRLTAVSQVTIHYQGPFQVFLPVVMRP